jgi:hypothetical protein
MPAFQLRLNSKIKPKEQMKTLSKMFMPLIGTTVAAMAWHANAQTNRYTSQLPQTTVLAPTDFFMVVTGTSGAYGTRLIPTLSVQSLPGWPAGGATNGFVDARVTNGLASLPYVNLATNGFVDARVTNGLSTIPYVQAQIQAATNGLAGGTLPNGLVTNNSPATVTVAGSGVASTLATNAVTSPSVIANTVIVSNSLTGPASLSLTNPNGTNIFAGQVIASLLNSTNLAGTNNLAGNLNIGGNLTAGNIVPLQNGYVPYTNLNPVMFAAWMQFTNAIHGNTNAALPANTTTIRAWVNFTNISGGVFKLPLYQ